MTAITKRKIEQIELNDVLNPAQCKFLRRGIDHKTKIQIDEKKRKIELQSINSNLFTDAFLKHLGFKKIEKALGWKEGNLTFFDEEIGEDVPLPERTFEDNLILTY